MEIIDAARMSAGEIAGLMKKPAFDECTLSPNVSASVCEMFGEPLSASQVVDRIVSQVRRDGDEKLLHYTSLLDKDGCRKKGNCERSAVSRGANAQVLADQSRGGRDAGTKGDPG